MHHSEPHLPRHREGRTFELVDATHDVDTTLIFVLSISLHIVVHKSTYINACAMPSCWSISFVLLNVPLQVELLSHRSCVLFCIVGLLPLESFLPVDRAFEPIGGGLWFV